MSLVRSLKKEEIDPEPSLSWLGEHLGFLRDEHQMNVGLTRARRGLCIIGEKNCVVAFFLPVNNINWQYSHLTKKHKQSFCAADCFCFVFNTKRTNQYNLQK